MVPIYRDGTASQSSEHQPEMWKTVRYCVRTGKFNRKQLNELCEAYRKLYRQYRNANNYNSWLYSREENLQISNEDQRILEISLNIDELIIGALFDGCPSSGFLEPMAS